jgi:hypothetical protein
MQVFNQRRIAFVFCPNLPETTSLDTIPFAAHVVRLLATSEWEVDVFLWSNPAPFNDNGIASENIHYKRVWTYTKHSNTYSKHSNMNLAELTLRFARHTSYKCVFSVGRIGSYFGRIVSMASRCPFVLLNDEFPSLYGQSRWLPLERWGARHADVIVVPSDDRHTALREEFQLTADKPFVTIRNTPELTLPSVHVDWHGLMGIPHDRKIFIHAGTIADWAQVPEILGSASYWPEGAVLLLHNMRIRSEFVQYRKQLSHLENPERVFWSSDLLPENMLNSLTSSCNGSFALYRNMGQNDELIGTSSGKLMRSIVCGTPVITASFESLRFVTTEGLGIQVTHPAEIPPAIDNLIKNGPSYRERCLRFAVSEKTLREEAWNKIVQCVKDAPNGVDLSRCGF